MRVAFAIAGLVSFTGCGDSKSAQQACVPSCEEPEPVDETGSAPTDSGTSPSAEETGDARVDTGTDADDTGSPLVNLLDDPGFESGAGAWSIWGGAERSEAAPHSGRWALKATATNGAEQRVGGLEPNTVYRLKGWGKNNDTEPLLIGVKDYGGDEVRVSFTEPEYRQNELTFTTGFTNTAATIYAYKHAGDTPAYADDLVLTAEGPSSRALVWSDEFDGSGPVDPSRWNYEEGFVRNEEVQWYQASNAARVDGMLVIEARSEDRPNPDFVAGASDWRTNRETITHSSASLTTKGLFGFQYGHLVVRAKVTNEVGTWPAIWTLGDECEWPSNGEVDVMENYGGNVLANFAWGSDSRWSPIWDSSHWPVSDFGPGWSDSFHLWEMEWSEDRITIRLDGAVLNDVDLSGTVNGAAACEGLNPFRQAHHIRLNLALGGAGGSVADLPLPTQYMVDYVRVYR